MAHAFLLHCCCSSRCPQNETHQSTGDNGHSGGRKGKLKEPKGLIDLTHQEEVFRAHKSDTRLTPGPKFCVGIGLEKVTFCRIGAGLAFFFQCHLDFLPYC